MSAKNATYRSGVAARMAGVPVETLRVWERRYGVIRPSKSDTGQRLYSEEEVRRLTLIKQVLDLGHPIGAIAALSTEDLKAMFAAVGSRARRDPGGVAAPPSLLRVALVGSIVGSGRFRELLMRNGGDSALTISGQAATPQALDCADTDLVIVELSTLDERSPATVRALTQRCGAYRAIVLYRYGRSSVIAAMRDAGHDVTHLLSDVDEVAALCRTLLRVGEAPLAATPPTNVARTNRSPRFDEQALLRFAQSSGAVHCECPRHLVELVSSLTAFELYSSECASRDPADAALHRDLQQMAGHARSLIEDAIQRVALAEGVTIALER